MRGLSIFMIAWGIACILMGCHTVTVAAQKNPRPTKKANLQAITVLDGNTFRYRPGDVIALPAGEYTKLTIKNFKGTARRPVIFVNHGGAVIIENHKRGGGAIDLVNCQHVRITGSAPVKWPEKMEIDPLSKACGIRIAVGKNGPHAMNVIKRSSYIEIDHVEVFGAGFAGFNVKDEPSTVTREDFTMRNISLHHNYVHNTEGEGFYVGHTFYYGYDPKKTGNPKMPHVIHGLRIYNNVFKDTGCEGIQVGSAEQDVEIHNNVVINPGIKPFAKWQDNGIQIGAGTQGKIYNNLIINAPSNGMIIFGMGALSIYNNVIVDAGTNGIYCNTKKGDSYHFIHNTIIAPAEDALRISNNKQPMAQVIVANNLFVSENSKGMGLNNMNRNAPIQEENNISIKLKRNVGFMDTEKHDYRPAKGSPIIGKARTAARFEVTLDMRDIERGRRLTDVGALTYERRVDEDYDAIQHKTQMRITPWARP